MILLLVGGSLGQRSSRLRETKIDITRRGGETQHRRQPANNNRSPRRLDQRSVFDFTGTSLNPRQLLLCRCYFCSVSVLFSKSFLLFSELGLCERGLKESNLYLACWFLSSKFFQKAAQNCWFLSMSYFGPKPVAQNWIRFLFFIFQPILYHLNHFFK